MKKIYFLFMMILAGLSVSAQRKFPPELERRLQGKSKVVDIMQEVNQYYDFGKANITSENGLEED